MTPLQEMISTIEDYTPREIARILIDLGVTVEQITSWTPPPVDKAERDAILAARGFTNLKDAETNPVRFPGDR